MASEIPSELQARIDQGVTLERQLAEQLGQVKSLESQIKDFWKGVESEMLDRDIKSIKGEWGSLTIAERLGWDVDMDALPRKFVKRVADTAKLSASYRLEGKAPAGASPKFSRFLQKRIKEV